MPRQLQERAGVAWLKTDYVPCLLAAPLKRYGQGTSAVVLLFPALPVSVLATESEAA